MALFRRLFYRKPPDRLLEISERVYVFDCCFSSDIMEENEYKNYLGFIVAELQDHFPDTSFMVCNFREGDKKSHISDILSEYDMTVMDYPRQYERCPLLPLEMIHHFLKSSESWLSVEGQNNVLLMHCERGGWPVLAFMLAGFLLYRKQYTGEQKTLEMVYRQAPKELLHLFCPLNPQPSHMRYLQYITRQLGVLEWPPKDKSFLLKCIILSVAPLFDDKGGCRAVVRIYGQDPQTPTNRSSRILFSTPKTKKHVRHYRQEENAIVKLNCGCHVRGDVIIECIHVNEDLDYEEMMCRIMFNTAFVESEMLLLNRDEIDVAWNAKDQFPRDFKAKVILSDFDATESEVTLKVTASDDHDNEREGEEFFEAEEIFNNSEMHVDTQLLHTKRVLDVNGSNSGVLVTDIIVKELEGTVAMENSNNIINDKLKRIDRMDALFEPSKMEDQVESTLEASVTEHDVISEKNINLDNVIALEEKRMLESSILMGKTDASCSTAEEESTSKYGNTELETIFVSKIENFTQTTITMDACKTEDLMLANEGNSCMVSSSVSRESMTSAICQRASILDCHDQKNISQTRANRLSILDRRVCNSSDVGAVDQTKHEINTHNCGHGMRSELKLCSDSRLETQYPADQAESESEITIHDKAIITEKLIALDEMNGVEGNTVAEINNLKPEGVVAPQLMEKKGATETTHLKFVVGVFIHNEDVEIDKPNIFILDADAKSAFERSNSKNDLENISIFKESTRGEKTRAVNFSSDLNNPMCMQGINDYKSDNSNEASASQLLTQMKENGIRIQTNEKFLPYMPEQNSMQNSQQIESAVLKNKCVQQESSDSLKKATSSKLVPRWISPKRTSDATSIHWPSNPLSRYNSSPPALAISSHASDEMNNFKDIVVQRDSFNENIISAGGTPSPSFSSILSPKQDFVHLLTSCPRISDSSPLSPGIPSVQQVLPPPPPPLPSKHVSSSTSLLVSSSTEAPPSHPPPIISQISLHHCSQPSSLTSPTVAIFTPLYSPSPLACTPHFSKISSRTLMPSQPPPPLSPTPSPPLPCGSSMKDPLSSSYLPILDTSTIGPPRIPSPSTMLPEEKKIGSPPPPPPPPPPLLSSLTFTGASTKLSFPPSILPPTLSGASIKIPPPHPPPPPSTSPFGGVYNGVLPSPATSMPNVGGSKPSIPTPPPPPPKPTISGSTPSLPTTPPFTSRPTIDGSNPCSPHLKDFKNDNLGVPPLPPPPPPISSLLTYPGLYDGISPLLPFSKSNASKSTFTLPPHPPPLPSSFPLSSGPPHGGASNGIPHPPLNPNACATPPPIIPPPPPPPSKPNACGSPPHIPSHPPSPPPPPPPPPPRLPPPPLMSTTGRSTPCPPPLKASMKGYLRESSSLASPPPPPPPPPPPSVSLGTLKPSTPPQRLSVLPPPPPPMTNIGGAHAPHPHASGFPPPPPPPLGGCPKAPLHSGGNQKALPSPPLSGGRGSAPPPPPLPSGRHSDPPPPPPGGRGTLQALLKVPDVPPPPPVGVPNTPGGSRGPPPPSLLTVGRGQGLSRSIGSGSSSQAPRRSSLKPLHWVKVTRAVQGSLWAELQKSGDAPSASDFDVSELECLFSSVNRKSDDSSKLDGKRKSVGSKSEKVHLIELRRANNTEIMLTKVKIPLPELMGAALALDDSVLDVDQVDNLIKFCPTKEEMELLKGYHGDKEKLGKCEQFFLELMKVPRVESKLRVFSFKIQFYEQIADLRKSLSTIDSTCEQIRSSEKLKEIMKKILCLGNMLNQGTARGSAIGFRLDSLLKLADTRATNNKMTLMHFLCKVIASRSAHLLDFHKDLTNLDSASKIQLKSLAEEMQAIVKGLEKVELELTASESDGPISSIFQKTLKGFTAVADTEVRSLASLYSAVGRNADALAIYFGEDPARCPFEQVISTLTTFVLMFRRAHQENCKEAELEKKKAKKEAEMEKSKSYKSVK